MVNTYKHIYHESAVHADESNRERFCQEFTLDLHSIAHNLQVVYLYKGGGNKKIRNRTETDKQKKQKLEQVELYLEDALLGWFVHKVAEHEASKVGVKTLVPDK